jgi:hypothetical protein
MIDIARAARQADQELLDHVRIRPGRAAGGIVQGDRRGERESQELRRRYLPRPERRQVGAHPGHAQDVETQGRLARSHESRGAYECAWAGQFEGTIKQRVGNCVTAPEAGRRRPSRLSSRPFLVQQQMVLLRIAQIGQGCDSCSNRGLCPSSPVLTFSFPPGRSLSIIPNLPTASCRSHPIQLFCSRLRDARLPSATCGRDGSQECAAFFRGGTRS